jgi:hypothetical protein
MQDVVGLDVGRLKIVVSQTLLVSPASMKIISANDEGRLKRVVFRAKMNRRKRGDCAVKCFVHASEDSAAKDRVSKETDLAEWASREGIGAPVHAVAQLPETTVLVMAMALGDFEGVLKSRQRLSYMLVRDLFKQAFRLATHEKLVSRGMVCADLKPANFLVHFPESRKCAACDLAAVVKKGGSSVESCSLELRLVDFDPFFWSKTDRRDAAALNTFFLLANCVLWKTPGALGPYMPEEAFRTAEAVRSRDPSLVEVLSKHLRLLRRGPFHYSRLSSDCEAPLEALLSHLSDALVAHGFDGVSLKTI